MKDRCTEKVHGKRIPMNILTFDVGGTEIKYVVIPDSAEIGQVRRIKTPLDSLEHYLDAIEGVYRSCGEKIDGIAMSVPGVVDPATGYQKSGGMLQFISEMNIAKIISERCDGIPVTLENDAKAAGFAELTNGTLKNARNSCMCVIGTAVGGCVIIDRKIYRSANDFAGEFSFIVFDRINKEKGETFHPVWGLRTGVHYLYQKLADRTGEDVSGIDGFEFFGRANAGDPKALEALHEFCAEMILPIANIQAVIDPEVISIGGGVSAQPIFIETINEEYDRFMQDDFGAQLGIRKKPQIVQSTFGNKANLAGAYYNFLYQNGLAK